MAVNEVDLTVVGWVGNEPTVYRGDEGQVPFTKFRLASTPRVYDRERDMYVDADTSWFTVKVFRQLAQNVAESLRRGDPVVVHGRLRLEDWVAPDGHTRTTAELTADSVGHDLARGTSRFSRTVHEVRNGSGGGDGADGGASDGDGTEGGGRDGGRPADAGARARQSGVRPVVPFDVSGAVELPEDAEALTAEPVGA
ncbi:single-stranded DNA-binding protein [Cellulomonas endometrii]|uniref:single-stranded DNA-binding protein n=1 Tax=Cellulomonas endometrii TaxID=3036301 RepID=UPI0024ADFF66|nr:single-stranded DNA-binding protein [Cellulomonas endometrii]